MRRCILFLLLTTCALSDEIIIQELKSVQVKGFSGSDKEVQKQLKPFLGKPLTQQKIEEIKQTVLACCRSQNHPVAMVKVPQQDVTNGTLKLVVTETKIGEVHIRGNEWFPTKKLKEMIRLKRGNPLNSRTLTEDLYWINRNPFRQADVVLMPGKNLHTTDLDITVKDRLPFRPYVGGDNTGLDQTGNGRLFAGFNWGNAWRLDHTISYQFTKSTQWSHFYAHTANYTFPMPWWRHVVVFYGGYSSLRPFMPSPDLMSRLRSLQISMRYDIPLPSQRDLLHEFTWGMDYKKQNNGLTFGDAVIIGNKVVLTQFMTGYNLGYENSWLKLPFEAELYWEPGDLFAHQKTVDFTSLRPFAKNHYVYSRAVLAPTFRLPWDFSIFANFRGQWSSANLISSETFGIGGWNTVRGYDERILNGDSAVLASLEVRTPPKPFFYMFSQKKNDSLQFLAFFDYGLAIVHKAAAGEPKSDYVMSLGPGLRYLLSTYVEVRFDFGFQLHHLPRSIEKRHSKGHISVIVNY